jgi:hypothetical protein
MGVPVSHSLRDLLGVPLAIEFPIDVKYALQYDFTIIRKANAVNMAL